MAHTTGSYNTNTAIRSTLNLIERATHDGESPQGVALLHAELLLHVAATFPTDPEMQSLVVTEARVLLTVLRKASPAHATNALKALGELARMIDAVLELAQLAPTAQPTSTDVASLNDDQVHDLVNRVLGPNPVDGECFSFQHVVTGKRRHFIILYNQRASNGPKTAELLRAAGLKVDSIHASRKRKGHPLHTFNPNWFVQPLTSHGYAQLITEMLDAEVDVCLWCKDGNERVVADTLADLKAQEEWS